VVVCVAVVVVVVCGAVVVVVVCGAVVVGLLFISFVVVVGVRLLAVVFVATSQATSENVNPITNNIISFRIFMKLTFFSTS